VHGATNITVRYKYFGALHLDASLGARPTNITVLYKYCGALHRDASLNGAVATNIAVRCTLTPPRVHGATKIAVRCTLTPP
jgi:hypothetical protein